MTQVVQAKCPHCQNVLRIPAEWLTRPMRCKFCKQVIQARTSSSGPGATPVPPATPAMPQPRPSGPRAVAPQAKTGPRHAQGGMFQFEEVDDQAVTVPITQRARKKSKTPLIAAVVVGCLALAATLTVLFAGDRLNRLFSGMTEVVEDGPDEGEGKKTIVGGDSKGLFPRRALLISVNNYWLLNPVHYGSAQAEGYPGSSTAVLAARLSGAPMYFPATQVTEISDGASIDPVTPSKFVVENAIADFANTSREQDRILVLFAGHAIDIDKVPYLIPFEGDKDDVKTLVPLSWVYDQLAKCKARQKILVLDVFRFPPARGYELPGTGAMTEDFDAKLAAPPPGVQVWTSCLKDQQSIEFGGGSVFMQCFCHALQERLGGFAQPDEAIPIDAIAPKVNQRLKEVLAKTEFKQESRLAGSETAGGGAYDSSEPPPPKLVIRQPDSSGGDKAGAALVNNILAEMRQIPPMKPELKKYMKSMKAEALPAFPKKIMDFYAADYQTWDELESRAMKEPDKYPLRAAVLQAKKAMDESEKLKLTTSIGGPINEKAKGSFLDLQKPAALAIFELESALAVMEEAAEKRKDEPSKRWQAHFDYTMARLQARLVYINEYNYILGDIRADRLPALEGDNTGWELGFREKLSTNENKVKTMSRELGKLWKKIGNDHPNTPWALLARREAIYAMGLQWVATRQ